MIDCLFIGSAIGSLIALTAFGFSSLFSFFSTITKGVSE